MSANNVVSLQAVREIKKAEQSDPQYEGKISKMDKLQLLEEMMAFQEERSRLGYLTFQMMIQGQILFRALEATSETEELRCLARSYSRHLKFEMESYLNQRRIHTNNNKKR